MSGRVLAEVGVQSPVQYPEHTVLIHLTSTD